MSNNLSNKDPFIPVNTKNILETLLHPKTPDQQSAVKAFISQPNQPNIAKQEVAILYVSGYDFLTDRNEQKKCVTMTMTNREVINETNKKGISIETYSIITDNPELFVTSLPEVPFLAVVEIIFSKKRSILKNVYSVSQISNADYLNMNKIHLKAKVSCFLWRSSLFINK